MSGFVFSQPLISLRRSNMINFGPIFMRTFLSNLALQLPVLLVLGVGIVMAIVRWKKAPRASLLTLIGMVIIGFVTVLNGRDQQLSVLFP
jgi:hypothetical protein